MNRWIRDTNSLVFSAAVIGIFIILTIIFMSLPGLQADLTKEKRYTLSEHTNDVLSELKDDFQVYAFTGGDSVTDRQVVDMLQEYARRSDRITFDEVDASKNPTLTQELEVDTFGTVVFKRGDELRHIHSYQMFAQGNTQESFLFLGEERFTKVLYDFISEEVIPVYILTGHGEIPSTQLNNFYQSMRDEKYVPQQLNLALVEKIPDDAEIVMIIGLQQDITEEEHRMIREYMDRDGRLFVGWNYHRDYSNWPNILSLMGTYGIAPENGLTADPERRYMNNPNFTVPLYGFHTIVNKLDENNRLTVLPTPTPLYSEEKPGLMLKGLLHTTDNSYAKLNNGQETISWNKEEGDVDGPFTLGYAVETENRDPLAIIVGSATFLEDGVINEQGNRDFIMNSLGWLYQKEKGITIRAREETLSEKAFILPADVNKIMYSTLIGIPGVFLLLGGVVWWRRRKG